MFSKYKKRLKDEHDPIKMVILSNAILRMLHFNISEKQDVKNISDFTNNQEISKRMNEIEQNTFKIMEVFLIVIFARILARIKSNKFSLINRIPSFDVYFEDTWSALSAIAIILNWSINTNDSQKIAENFRDEIIFNLSKNNNEGLRQVRKISVMNEFGRNPRSNKVTRGSIWVSAAYHSTDYLLNKDIGFIQETIASDFKLEYDPVVIKLLTKNLTVDIDRFIDISVQASEAFWNSVPRSEKEMTVEVASTNICSIISHINENRAYWNHLDNNYSLEGSIISNNFDDDELQYMDFDDDEPDIDFDPDG